MDDRDVQGGIFLPRGWAMVKFSRDIFSAAQKECEPLRKDYCFLSLLSLSLSKNKIGFLLCILSETNLLPEKFLKNAA